MYIINDQIEGVFIDENEELYELVGSCSYRTKEFEIIGLSQSKTKSIKIRGLIDGLKLKGNFSIKPSKSPDSQIEFQMGG